MSLGVRHLWRFWRHASLAPRVSPLIPRGPPFPVRDSRASARTYRAAVSFSSSRALFTAATTSSIEAQDRDGDAAERSSSSLESAANIAAEDTSADDGSELAPVPAPAPAEKSRTSLIERLITMPVRAHETRLPVVVKPFNSEYSHLKERLRDWRLHKTSLYRVRYHMGRHPRTQKLDWGHDDWRTILVTLMNATPSWPPFAGSAQIFIPEDLVTALKADSANSIWEIQSRSGCLMWLHDERRHVPEDRPYILLAGETSAIRRAVRDILEFGYPIKVVPLTEEEAKPLQKRRKLITWDSKYPNKEDVHIRQYFLDRPLDQIDKPKTWTRKSFELYITAVIRSRPPSSRYYELTGGKLHTRDIVWTLSRAFHDPAARPALTNASFKHALRYLNWLGDAFTNHVLRLVDMMDSLEFGVDPEVYDIRAASAVKVGNLGGFHAYVNYMIHDYGHSPTFQTWMNFVRLIKVDEIRRYIVYAMASRGVLNHPLAIQRLSTELVEDDVHRAIKLGLDAKSFVASQDQIYGPQWLHHNTAGKVLDTLGSYGRFDDMNDFLTVMFKTPQARPQNEIALNIVLTHCRNQHKLATAVGFVKRFEDEGLLNLDGITFHLLSDMAFKLRRPHVFSVLWRYSQVVMLTHRRLTMRLHRLFTSIPSTRRTRLVRKWTARLNIQDVLPRPVEGEPDKYSTQQRHESDNNLHRALQNLVFCDYKKARRIRTDRLLTVDEVKAAVEGWYRESFQGRKPIDKLGDLLERAMEEDYKIVLDSHQGKEITLDPLPFETVSTLKSRRKKRVVIPAKKDCKDTPRIRRLRKRRGLRQQSLDLLRKVSF